MDTELGKIKILINEREVHYKSIELANQSHYFSVKGRAKLICNIPQQLRNDIHIKCMLEIKENMQVDSGSETGENLALVSFYWKNSKLSIGTRGDLQGVKYNYLKNAIEVVLPENIGNIAFYVAWLDMLDAEREDIYTWFAADPAYDE